jgi:hypothetical protein
MRVEGKFRIKGRGLVLTSTVDYEVPAKGLSVFRFQDAHGWRVRGVERFAMDLNRESLYAGERVGLLVPDECELDVGDSFSLAVLSA